MKILLTSGARPNFMKLSPIVRALRTHHPNVIFKIVHTGQHYDSNMSDVFFKDLEIPEPHYNLGVGSMSHGEQTGYIMIEFEKVCVKEKPDVVVVIGDVNSTLACALVAAKLHIKVAHVEAGLRSFDMTMPEEINRIVADSVSDYLFCTIEEARVNLISENYEKSKIYLVGDTMIDNLLYNVNKIKQNPHGKDPYITVTLHRASNTDDKETLTNIFKALNKLSESCKVKFPMHPRTQHKVIEYRLEKYLENIEVLNPMGFIDFLTLMKYSKVILTDSGGLQIEAAALKIPCVTMRKNTEQVDTLEGGYNILVGSHYDSIIEATLERLSPKYKLKKLDDGLRDGKVSERIVNIMIKG